jgi:hypothetical protein
MPNVDVIPRSGPSSIRILERDNNRRGDLFGRLMTDLFLALGYDQPQLNVHKSGRELDLSADHRLERRRAIGECKATAEKIGGDEVNKFVGALDAEHTEDKRPITGYFVSLAGFRETTIEQEKQRERTKIILLAGSQVIDELIIGRMLVTKERAAEIAGRFCAGHEHLVLDEETELLAHERGWIWAVYYTQGKSRTHFVLVHSDGTPLVQSVAETVIQGDRQCGGQLHQLLCLNPQPIGTSKGKEDIPAALAAYRRYIENECGYIHLDGLPADGDVGSTRLRLENLFVPQHLSLGSKSPQSLPGERDEVRRQAVGDVILAHSRLALLGAPGAGKSTLVKRLAIAYANSSRRDQLDDALPAQDWLPLFFRCRELRELARGSFAELLVALSQRELVRQYAATFLAHIDDCLLAGKVLLLVDGLDEISDPGDRAAFVCTIRMALQAYPNVAAVITSREAGYRHVAAHLASMCTMAKLSPFNDADVKRLTVAWHREVVGEAEKVKADAEQLAETIVRNDRIRPLAVNPLLLTTLLLVRRWVGSLPTRRAVLYAKAVEVLLMTWNTEGHEPIPDEEALPQLCYVASSMMLAGLQKVSRPRLSELLREARQALPTELGYVKGTVDEFIHRVEDRSSLLMMSGLDVEHGRLVEFFEFRHLTFQEFLTARGMVAGWYPARKDKDCLATALAPHFQNAEWREVIPLAAVMGGKETDELIAHMTLTCAHSRKDDTRDSDRPSIEALCNCLADEAAARPETIRSAISEIVRYGSGLERVASLPILMRGRYGAEFREEARKAYNDDQYYGAESALLLAVWWQSFDTAMESPYEGAAIQFIHSLESSSALTRCEGALGSVFLCYDLGRSGERRKGSIAPQIPQQYHDILRKLGHGLSGLLFSESDRESSAAAWALAWMGQCQVWTPPTKPNVVARLANMMGKGANGEIRRRAAWALSTLPIGSREPEAIPLSVFRSLEKLVRPNSGVDEEIATLVIAWYARALTDANLAARIETVLKSQSKERFTRSPAIHQLRKLVAPRKPKRTSLRKGKVRKSRGNN